MALHPRSLAMAWLAALFLAMLLAASGAALAAAEAPAAGGPRLDLLDAPIAQGPLAPAPRSPPGQGLPRSAPRSGAYLIDWDRYRSWVVIGPGLGTVRPAWVATLSPDGALVVAYRARASGDAAGDLHLDARSALVVGPEAFDQSGARRWWPDSMALSADGTVRIQDEQPSAEVHAGRVQRVVHAMDAGYRDLRQRVEQMTDQAW